MPHIHKLFDFVVSVFIVHKNRVLLIHHKKYDRWLPIGGHIELDEDPEQALYREIREECGLKVKILAAKPPIAHPGVKPVLTPSYVDVHAINRTHKHIAFVYFAKAATDKVILHEEEHYQFKWFRPQDLNNKKYALSKSIKFYCRMAFRRRNTK
ncbi:MAG: NUDIX domain-containing protein [Candidatus Omnitrophica bacterium]|nr:NUDIX domain-containing protein [Candidatus Omnitrophota bacterium]